MNFSNGTLRTGTALLIITAMLAVANPAVAILAFIVIGGNYAVRNYRLTRTLTHKSGSGILPTEFMPVLWGISILIAAAATFAIVVAVANTVAWNTTKREILPAEVVPGLGPMINYMESLMPGAPPQLSPTPSGTVTVGPSGTTTVVQQPGTTAVNQVAQLRYTIASGSDNTGVTAGNEIVNIVKDGSFAQAHESLADITANPANTGKTYGPGDRLTIFVSGDNDVTGGTDYYMQTYDVTLGVGNPVVNKERGITVGTVSFFGAGATTPYWELQTLHIWPRANTGNTDVYLKLSTTLVSITDGTTFVTAAATLSSSQQGTLGSNTDSMYVQIVLGATNLSYGIPYYTLSSDSTPVLQLRESFVWLSFDNTNVKVSGENWEKASAPSTSVVTYTKRVPAWYGTTAQRGDWQVRAPLDTTSLSASTQFLVYQHGPSDGQTYKDAVGATGLTGAASGYGALTPSNSISPDAPIYARPAAYSSGTPTTVVLLTRIQTPA